MNAIISPTEQLLLQCQTKRSFTRFYSVLSQTDVLNVPAAAKTWQNELGVNIDEGKWDVIWNHTRKISVCNHARLLQYKILHRLQMSPKRHKMNP